MSKAKQGGAGGPANPSLVSQVRALAPSNTEFATIDLPGSGPVDIVIVPVTKEKPSGTPRREPPETVSVSLYAEDYLRFCKTEASTEWYTNKGDKEGKEYVRFDSPLRGNNSMVARVILGVLPRKLTHASEADAAVLQEWHRGDSETVVGYRDGKTLNLLRHNLELRISGNADTLD